MEKNQYRGCILFTKAVVQYFLQHMPKNPSISDYYKAISGSLSFSNDIKEISTDYSYNDDKIIIKDGPYANAKLEAGNYDSIFTISQSGVLEYGVIVLYDKNRTALTMRTYESVDDIISKNDIATHKRYTGDDPILEEPTTKITMDKKFIMLFPGSDITETVKILFMASSILSDAITDLLKDDNIVCDSQELMNSILKSIYTDIGFNMLNMSNIPAYENEQSFDILYQMYSEENSANIIKNSLMNLFEMAGMENPNIKIKEFIVTPNGIQTTEKQNGSTKKSPLKKVLIDDITKMDKYISIMEKDIKRSIGSNVYNLPDISYGLQLFTNGMIPLTNDNVEVIYGIIPFIEGDCDTLYDVYYDENREICARARKGAFIKNYLENSLHVNIPKDHYCILLGLGPSNTIVLSDAGKLFLKSDVPFITHMDIITLISIACITLYTKEIYSDSRTLRRYPIYDYGDMIEFIDEYNLLDDIPDDVISGLILSIQDYINKSQDIIFEQKEYSESIVNKKNYDTIEYINPLLDPKSSEYVFEFRKVGFAYDNINHKWNVFIPVTNSVFADVDNGFIVTVDGVKIMFYGDYIYSIDLLSDFLKILKYHLYTRTN